MDQQKKALIFSPYLNTRGGGEVYTLQFAECLKQYFYDIEFAWRNYSDIKKAEDLLGIRLGNYKVNKDAFNLFTEKTSVFKKFLFTRNYDLVFFVSDGSLPFLFGKKNILHYQVPFTNLSTAFPNRLKLRSIDHIVCNSRFTRKFIDNQLDTKSQVLYPPVTTQGIRSKKSDVIVAVGRFTDTLHNKRQDVLIEAFARLYNAGYASWKLKLIGSTSQHGSKEYVKKLKAKAKGLPIEFLLDVPQKKLNLAYATAKIFWHAAGYDIDERKHPEKVEHFGIVTVEAMQSGCVPVVINKGGQKEIVNDGHDGFRFNTVSELVSKTKILLSHPRRYEKMSLLAEETSKKFSNERFCKQVGVLIK